MVMNGEVKLVVAYFKISTCNGPTSPHGVLNQNTTIDILISVRKSNLILYLEVGEEYRGGGEALWIDMHTK
jgi:hypothetical protein